MTALASKFLVPVSGPAMEAFTLEPKESGLTLGRHDSCELLMPADADRVSRHHARFSLDGEEWRIADLGSRWGTFLNGVKLSPNAEVPLNEGDLIRISPWTFNFSSIAKRRGMQTADDIGRTMVRAVAADTARPLRDDMLTLLLESAAAIHGAQNERELAELVMDAAVRGTNLQNAVMLRPIDSAGHIEIIASRLSQSAQNSGVTFSRSLLKMASEGNVAEISGAGTGDISQSMVQMQINSALCVPLMLGPAPAAYLYLDSRGGVGQTLRPNASAFCVALGRMASLALANLKRIDIERRQAHMESELRAAATAQKWILPKRESRISSFLCLGESRPGQFIGGDFFDIIDLGEGRIAITVGDVTGKGIAASVLMTATQGFLHAALTQHGDPGSAVTALNDFINPRRPENKFVTVWVGIFDGVAQTLQYVDAGHSYALLQTADGELIQLDSGGGLPVGVMQDSQYTTETVQLAPGGRVMVVSDGIIEQFGMVARDDGTVVKDQFELDGVKRSLITSDGDAIASLFAAVIQHAGTSNLSDDATAVMVKWCDNESGRVLE